MALQGSATPLEKAALTLRHHQRVCRCYTILSVGNRSGKMSVRGRTDVDYEGTDKVADLERGAGALVVGARGGRGPGGE